MSHGLSNGGGPGAKRAVLRRSTRFRGAAEGLTGMRRKETKKPSSLTASLFGIQVDFFVRFVVGGAGQDRTDDLLNAIQALSQLSYSPTTRSRLLIQSTTPVNRKVCHTGIWRNVAVLGRGASCRALFSGRPGAGNAPHTGPRLAGRRTGCGIGAQRDRRK